MTCTGRSLVASGLVNVVIRYTPLNYGYEDARLERWLRLYFTFPLSNSESQLMSSVLNAGRFQTMAMTESVLSDAHEIEGKLGELNSATERGLIGQSPEDDRILITHCIMAEWKEILGGRLMRNQYLNQAFQFIPRLQAEPNMADMKKQLGELRIERAIQLSTDLNIFKSSTEG